ncbi:unnamed protein product [Lota lota]
MAPLEGSFVAEERAFHRFFNIRSMLGPPGPQPPSRTRALFSPGATLRLEGPARVMSSRSWPETHSFSHNLGSHALVKNHARSKQCSGEGASVEDNQKNLHGGRCFASDRIRQG